MVERYVLINKDEGYIENVILWDGVTPFELPENTEIKLESEIDYSTIERKKE